MMRKLVCKSGTQPGEAINSLASYLKQKRQDGFFIFSKTHINNLDIYQSLHDQHLDKIKRQGDIEEQAANQHYRGKK